MLEDARAWAEIISAIGTTGVLLVFVLLFVRGDIISRKSLDIIAKGIATEIVSKIKELIRDD